MTDEAARGPIAASREWSIVLCVAMMAFSFQFESALVTTSLPDIARELSASTSGVALVLLSYLLGASITFLPAGKLGDRHGLRIVCLTGCMAATIATLFCGLAGSLEALSFWRFVQGVGAGAFVAAGYALIPMWVPAERVGRAYGLQSLGAGLGMATGVPVGGILSNFFTWHWIFLATVPLLMVLLVVAWRVIPSIPGHANTSRAPISWLALALFSATLLAVTVILSAGPAIGWISPLTAISSGVVVVLFLALFNEKRNGRPLFSSGLIRANMTVLGLTSMALMAAVVGGVRYAMPFYLELGCGLGILASSLLLLAYPLSYAPMSMAAGKLADKWTSGVVLIWSVVICVCVLALATFLAPFGSPKAALLFLIVFGLATGLYFAPANRWIMTAVPEALRGEAGGVLSVVFNFGTLAGVALFQVAMTWGASRQAVTSVAFSMEYSYCFAMGAVISALALGCVLRGRRPTVVLEAVED